MSSAPLRARSPFFAFDTETGSRRPRWVIFLAGLLAVLIGLAGLVGGVSAASAHDRDLDVSCFGITVKLTNYNSSGQNQVSVVVDGTERVPLDKLTNFGQNYTFQTTWDPAVAHTYAVEVKGQDGYNLSVKPTTQQPCAKPVVGLTATVCNTTDGSTTLTATASGFAAYSSPKQGYPSFTETYTGTLFRDGSVYQTVANVEADADGTFTWTGEQAGHTYSWEVKGTKNGSLVASAQAVSVACPQLKELAVSANQCTVTTGNNATVSVTAKVVPGREYTVQVLKDGAPYGGSYTIPASNTAAVYPPFTLGVPENVTGLSVLITDVAAPATDPSKTKQSTTFQTIPCPKVPGAPVVTADVCTQVGGSLSLHVTFSGLVPGRAYDILVNGVKVLDLTASTSSFPTTGTWDYPVPAGDYTVTITDELVTTATNSSAVQKVAACPTQPDVSLTPTQCLEAGGAGDIAVSFLVNGVTSLGAGREYLVSITENGNAVPGHVGSTTITSASPALLYTGLAAGKIYTVTVIDKLAAGVMDAATIQLDACPMTPKLTLDLECLFLEGDSLVSATIGDLAPGEDYVVTIEPTVAPAPLADGGTSASAGLAVLDSETVTGAPTASTVTFQVPNKADYTVTVTKVTNSKVTSTATIYAAICDLPTFSLPSELPTLALTGAGDTTLPMLGALGLVQFGVALLALAAMLQFAPRRRAA